MKQFFKVKFQGTTIFTVEAESANEARKIFNRQIGFKKYEKG